MPDDSYLVTSGDTDNTIMIWAYKAADIGGSVGGGSPLNLSIGNGNKDSQRDADINDDLERESLVGKRPITKKTASKAADDEDENLLA